MFYNGGIKLINEKMEKIKITIKNVIYEFFPPYYLNYVFSGKITLDDIAMQVLMECCKYAYDCTAEKHSLRYYIELNGLDIDNDRMMLQRTVQKINKFRQAEYNIRKEQIGIEIKELQPKDMKSIDDKLLGYEFNEFQFWEINNVHDLKLIDDIICGKIFKKNYTTDKFKMAAEEYDNTVLSMISYVGGGDKRAFFSSLALFTLEWKYAFDFYYKVAEEMDKKNAKFKPNLKTRCSLFCGPVGITSCLIPRHQYLIGGTIHTDSRMMLLRDKFVQEFVSSSEEEFKRFSLQYAEAIVLVSAMLTHMTYQDINIREWFKVNSTLQDWTDITREYNVALCFAKNKAWTNKRIRYVKKIYESIYSII